MATTFAPSLATLNHGTRPSSRTDRNMGSGSSKNYILPVPSGFRVRVFKTPMLSASSRQQPPATKGDAEYRLTQPRGTGDRDSHRKLTKAHSPQITEDFQGRSGRFGVVHTGPVPDAYIYERPVALSPDPYYYSSSDGTGSDMDSLFSATHSATSSSSSIESPRRAALQLALLPHERRSHGHSQRNAVAYPGNYSTCPTCAEMSTHPEPFPTSRVDPPSQGSRPLPTPPGGTRVRKDSLQLTSERSPSMSRPHLPPLRIDDGPTYPIYVHGIYHGQWQPDGDIPALPPQLTRSGSQKSVTSSGSGSYVVPPPPGLAPPTWEHPLAIVPVAGGEIYARPHRRNSDGDNPHVHPARRARSQTAPVPRSVRWCENLICPSPILPHQRRKGWFNRRGDQLWRNDGGYKSPPPGEAYPPDLDDYPEPEEGWQNEDGVRIDHNHRLIPKVPLRGVLKRTNYCPEEGIVAGYPDFAPSPTSDDDCI